MSAIFPYKYYNMGDYYGPSAQETSTAPRNCAAVFPDPLAADEISVLVTGFGPFKSNVINASYLIASSLPSSLSFPDVPAASAPLPTVAEAETPTPTPRRISIYAHPFPITVSYSTVRTAIPAIFKDYAQAHGGRRPDIILHIGIASTRTYYSVECQAHRDSYYITDVNGRLGYEDGEKLWKKQGLPPVIQPGPAIANTKEPSKLGAPPTAANLQDVPTASTRSGHAVQRSLKSASYPPNDHFLETWKSFVPVGADVRVSEDAGRYLCEFIYYTTMAHALEEGWDRNVAFFHVPGAHDPEAVDFGTNVAIALIKTLVTCWLDKAK